MWHKSKKILFVIKKDADVQNRRVEKKIKVWSIPIYILLLKPQQKIPVSIFIFIKNPRENLFSVKWFSTDSVENLNSTTKLWRLALNHLHDARRSLVVLLLDHYRGLHVKHGSYSHSGANGEFLSFFISKEWDFFGVRGLFRVLSSIPSKGFFSSS